MWVFYKPLYTKISKRYILKNYILGIVYLIIFFNLYVGWLIYVSDHCEA